MKVCIAEKPSVAREIANVLGAKDKKDGYFEGNGYQVTWTFGHFCTLYSPDNYNPDWKQWNLNNLPMLPKRFETKLMDNSGVKKQFKVIDKLFKNASVVINCGDAGQEGELIQRWVIKQANYQGKVLRLWISSLTTEAIKDGFQDLRDASDYDNLFYAGSSRAIGDWLLGMNATRLYTLRYGGFKQVLSIGRVQTPTLAMLVTRHKEIENFKPEPYWELQTLYRETMFNCTEGKFQKEEEGQALFEQVEGKPFVVTGITKKSGKELPPKLFDLTSLQVYCNNKFSYSAENTLKIVQKLYEKKYVTYPRVDTTFLPNDVYPKVAGILKKMTSYSQFTQPLLGKKIRKSKKVFDDKKVTDHHAIIPTGYGNPKSLGANEKYVYDIICRRFIAAFYPDCKVANTTVLGEVEEVKFKATGKEIIEPGWRVLFPKPKNSKQKEEDKLLPTFVKKETGPHEPSFVEKQTKPPKSYTEATLLRAMETAGKQVDDEELRELMKSNGIGRPSTRANIIETLFKRKYVQRKRKNLIPTEMGIQLIDTIQNDLLKSAELTGQWEKQLKEIEEGSYNAAQFIYDMKCMVHKLVGEVKAARGIKRLATPTTKKANVVKPKAEKTAPKGILDSICPKCKKGKLLKGQKAYGCSQWNDGCKFLLPFSFMEKNISENQLIRLVSKGSTVKLKGFKHGDKKIDGTLVFDENFEVQFRPIETATKTKKTNEVPNPIPCPKCKKGEVLKGQKAYGCSQWKAGCNFRFDYTEIKRIAAGKELTKALVWSIIKGERS